MTPRPHRMSVRSALQGRPGVLDGVPGGQETVGFPGTSRSGSDGTRTRDLRRDSAQVASTFSLQTAGFSHERSPQTAPLFLRILLIGMHRRASSSSQPLILVVAADVNPSYVASRSC